MRLASIEGFEQEPQAVLDFYNARHKQLLEVEPNEAHRILAELERLHDVIIVTQNVDNLHKSRGVCFYLSCSNLTAHGSNHFFMPNMCCKVWLTGCITLISWIRNCPPD